MTPHSQVNRQKPRPYDAADCTGNGNENGFDAAVRK